MSLVGQFKDLHSFDEFGSLWSVGVGGVEKGKETILLIEKMCRECQMKNSSYTPSSGSLVEKGR